MYLCHEGPGPCYLLRDHSNHHNPQQSNVHGALDEGLGGENGHADGGDGLEDDDGDRDDGIHRGGPGSDDDEREDGCGYNHGDPQGGAFHS